MKYYPEGSSLQSRVKAAFHNFGDKTGNLIPQSSKTHLCLVNEAVSAGFPRDANRLKGQRKEVKMLIENVNTLMK